MFGCVATLLRLSISCVYGGVSLLNDDLYDVYVEMMFCIWIKWDMCVNCMLFSINISVLNALCLELIDSIHGC